MLYAIFGNDIVVNIIMLAISAIWIPLNIVHIGAKLDMQSIVIAIFWPVVAMIIVGIFNSVAIFYKTRGIVNYKYAKASLQTVIAISGSWANRIQALIEEIVKTPQIDAFKEFFERHTDYRRRAKYICDMIYLIIKDTYSIDDHQVTLMHKSIDEKGEFIRMIAYKNRQDEPPGTYKVNFYLEDEKDKKYYHVKQFISKKRGIKVLPTQKDIKKEFIIHSRSSEREERLQQYISIPIIDGEKDILSLLQIDTTSAGVFGKKREEIAFLAETNIKPLCQFLSIWLKKDELASILKRCI
jgi:hypothetical protein